jgi:hypothetical protein
LNRCAILWLQGVVGKLGRKTRIALYVVGGLIVLGITGAAIGGPREITALLRA